MHWLVGLVVSNMFKTQQLYRCPHCNWWSANFFNCEGCGRDMSAKG